MIRISNLAVPLQSEPEELAAYAAAALGVPSGAVLSCRAVRRSLDARKKQNIHFLYTLKVSLSEKDERKILSRGIPGVVREETGVPQELPKGSAVLEAPVIIAGMGPAGLFAGYLLAKEGYRPLILERGRPVEERAADVSRFWSGGPLDTESNVMFGEGGAGTFSDGKLTTRIKDPRADTALDILCAHGAPECIRLDAKPHIGTDKLRTVVANLRKEIIRLGGTVKFSSKLCGLVKKDGRIAGVKCTDGRREWEEPCSALILAVGQGARDTYEMLFAEGIELAPKAFAVGVRAEHPQEYVDKTQYGAFAGHPRLGAAEYRLTAKSGGRGVYTFCMCPGGLVVASSSAAGEVVTNGMSDFARDRENANAAVVVQVGPEDFGTHPLAGMRFQQELEQRAFIAGGGDYTAPAERVGDFLRRAKPGAFSGVRPSYRPGVRKTSLWDCLPDFVAQGVSDGLKGFSRQMRGFDMPDAVLTAVESRTSAPVRILRTETGEATRLAGMYPVGEGAGYAGGIVSAAVDGLKAAERIIAQYRPL